MSLAAIYNLIGDYERGLEEGLQATHLDEFDWYMCNSSLVYPNLRLNRFEDAKRYAKISVEKKYFNVYKYHQLLFQIAFVDGNEKEMQAEIDWFKGRPDEYRALDLQSQAAAFRGEWRRSVGLSAKSVDGFLTSGRGDPYAIGIHAVNAAVLGDCNLAKETVRKVMGSFGNKEAEWRTEHFSAQALAMCGDTSSARSMVEDIARRWPEGTLGNGWSQPVIYAQIELSKGNANEAIRILKNAEKLEPASWFEPQFLRGEAYLKLGEREKAKGEFQKILDHRGEAPLSILYPLAQLGKARATRNKRDYDKFFDMWKDADPDLPILITARKEYKALG